jgi:hypothetical protein
LFQGHVREESHGDTDQKRHDRGQLANALFSNAQISNDRFHCRVGNSLFQHIHTDSFRKSHLIRDVTQTESHVASPDGRGDVSLQHALFATRSQLGNALTEPYWD